MTRKRDTQDELWKGSNRSRDKRVKKEIIEIYLHFSRRLIDSGEKAAKSLEAVPFAAKSRPEARIQGP